MRLQNGLVAPAPYQLLFKNIVLTSLYILVLVSEEFLECRVNMANALKMAG